MRMPLLPEAACLVACLNSSAQQKYFSNWPENADPHKVGDAVADRFVPSAHMNPIAYQEVCAWYGALTYAEATGNTTLATQLQARFQQLLTPEKQSLIPDKQHVDFEIFGVVPLQPPWRRRMLRHVPWACDSPTGNGASRNRTAFPVRRAIGSTIRT